MMIDACREWWCEQLRGCELNHGNFVSKSAKYLHKYKSQFPSNNQHIKFSDRHDEHNEGCSKKGVLMMLPC